MRHPRALRRAARRARCGRAHADAHGAAAGSDASPRQPQNERWPSTAHGAKGHGGPRGAEAELLGSGQARVRAQAQAQGRIRGSGAEVRPRGPRSAALSACRAPCTVAARQGTMAPPGWPPHDGRPMMAARRVGVGWSGCRLLRPCSTPALRLPPRELTAAPGASPASPPPASPLHSPPPSPPPRLYPGLHLRLPPRLHPRLGPSPDPEPHQAAGYANAQTLKVLVELTLTLTLTLNPNPKPNPSLNQA